MVFMESKFTLFTSHDCNRVWGRADELLAVACLSPRVLFGGGGGTITADRYIQQNLVEHFSLMQENARPHSNNHTDLQEVGIALLP